MCLTFGAEWAGEIPLSPQEPDVAFSFGADVNTGWVAHVVEHGEEASTNVADPTRPNHAKECLGGNFTGKAKRVSDVDGRALFIEKSHRPNC